MINPQQLGPNRCSPIGISWSGRTMHAVQLDGSRRRVLASASLERRFDGATAAAEDVGRLARAIERGGFVGRTVVLGAPAGMASSTMVKVSVRRGESFDEAAAGELLESTRWDPEQYEIAWWPLPDQSRRTDAGEIMAVGCPRDAAEQMLDLAEEEGLDVLALDIEAAAAMRWAQQVFEPGTPLRAAVLLDWNEIQFTAARDGVIVYQRTMPELGLHILFERLHREEKLEFDEIESLLREVCFLPSDEQCGPAPVVPDRVIRIVLAFAEWAGQEIDRAAAYVAGRHRDLADRKVALGGFGAGLPAFSWALSQHLEDAAIADSDAVLAPHLAVAAGLALYPTEAAA